MHGRQSISPSCSYGSDCHKKGVKWNQLNCPLIGGRRVSVKNTILAASLTSKAWQSAGISLDLFGYAFLCKGERTRDDG